MKGPDHSYALNPEELKTMVTNIRQVEASVGDPRKRFLPEEKQISRRKSLHAARDLEIGSKVTNEMVKISRPAHGINPRFINAIMGLETTRPIKKDEPITWEVFN